jgi:16S rRNA C967 or C1407 C5-methylase (RsmB/RsmF family)
MEEQPRYFRISQTSAVKGTQVDSRAEEVEWLRKWKPDKFYRMPATVGLVSNEFYVKGEVFGLDAASAAAVWALEADSSDTVLDICCAPGGKAFLIAEVAKEVWGVDVALHRLYTTRAMAKKYKINNLKLLLGDGRCPDKWQLLPMDKKRRRETTELTVPETFDRVLVDAECTHDASDRHVAKQTKLHGTFTSPWEGRESELFSLQVELLASGIRKVKIGGVVVYSTCSSKTEQNENVVNEVLDRLKGKVVLDPLPFDPSLAKAEIRLIRAEQTHACFFDPQTSQTSGLFLCRLRKVASSSCIYSGCLWNSLTRMGN